MTTQIKTIRTALVGISGYANVHYNKLLESFASGETQVVAATVINQEEEAVKCAHLRSIGCRIYSSFEAMIASERGNVDLCCIPTGIHLHSHMTITALEAGMNVLVEKPPAATLEEVDAMLDAEQKSGLKVFVGFQNIYAEPLWLVKEALLEQIYGPIQRIKCHVQWPRSESYYHRNNWAGKLSSKDFTILDSPANNAMAHFLMMSLFLSGQKLDTMGEIATANFELYRAQNIESFDTISSRCRTKNGIELLFNFTHSSAQNRPAVIEIECMNGRIHWTENGQFTCIPKQAGAPKPTYPIFPETRGTMFRNVFAHLHGDSSHCCSLKMARYHTAFIQRIHAETEILNFPQEAITRRQRDNQIFTQVNGLAEAMEQAHNNACLLSETEFHFAVVSMTKLHAVPRAH